MRWITIKKKKLIIITIILIFIATLFHLSTVFGMQNYYHVGFSTGLVTATTLNVRSGPGIQYGIVAIAPKNTYIRVFAGVGD